MYPPIKMYLVFPSLTLLSGRKIDPLPNYMKTGMMWYTAAVEIRILGGSSIHFESETTILQTLVGL